MSKTGKILTGITILLLLLILGWAALRSQGVTPMRHWTGAYDPHPGRPASRVAGYQLRFSTDSVNFFKDTLTNSQLVLYPGPVADSGKPDSMTVPGVPSDTRVWFAIRAVDSAGNVAGWSNIYGEAEPDRTPPSKVTTLH